MSPRPAGLSILEAEVGCCAHVGLGMSNAGAEGGAKGNVGWAEGR